MLVWLVVAAPVFAQDDAYLPVHDHGCQIRRASGFVLCYSEEH
jgi:hypothetical protein